VLRDVSVADGVKNLAPSAPRQRAFLAILTLDAGRVVTRSAIAEGIWGEAQPLHVDTALQVVKSRLIRALGAAGDRIICEGAGYRLDVGPDGSDISQAEALLRLGRQALAANDASRAANAFEEALDAFAGEPLSEFIDFPFYPDAARRIEELRFAIYEARNDAYLIDGRHLEVLADIDALLREQPLREHLRAQQITALYRSGRQAEALGGAADLRKILRDELGVDPSPGIQELERRVLDQDPTLLPSRAGVVPALPPWTSESLPFVGREKICELALATLRSAATSGVQFLLIEGERGIGKSRVLLELARNVGADAVIVPVDVHEAVRPSIEVLARGLSQAAARISATEREIMFGTGAAGELRRPTIEELQSSAPSWLAALSAKAPVLLLIDDIDRAGPALLHVMGQLAVSEQPRRVAIVATAQVPKSSHRGAVDRLVAVLETRGQGQRWQLGPLSEEEVDEVLGRMRIAPRRKLAAQLRELTGGNPFMLGELLSSGSPERIPELWDVPPRIRDVVFARVDELGGAATEVLQWAAVFGYEFDAVRLVQISRLAEALVTTMVERAVAAQILQPSGSATYRFVHELVRRTLAEELAPEMRRVAHTRIADALEGSDATPAFLAWHWAHSSAPQADEKTLQYASESGDFAMRAHEPNAAIRWYRLALERSRATSDRGRLLVRVAAAEQSCGDVNFVGRLREAARIAVETGDDELIVEIVNASSPGAMVLPGFETEEAVPLLHRAIEAATDDATRSRALSRLGTDEQLRDPQRAEAMLRDAISLARVGESDTALLDALLRHASFSLAPPSLEERTREIDEALPLAVGRFDVVAEYALHSLRVTAAVQRGDLAEADESIAVADRLATQYDLPSLGWSVKSRRAWRTALTGDLEQAEDLIRDAYRFGRDNGVMHARHNALIQLAALRWQQGRSNEILSEPIEVPVHLAALPGMRLVRARVLATNPASADAAANLVKEFAEDDFAQLPAQTPFWSTLLVVTAESALILQLEDAAATIYRMLEPFADQIAFTGNWVSAPIAYGLAVAAAASGSSADDMFEKTLAICERLNAPLLVARTQVAWVRATRMHSTRQQAPFAAVLCEAAASTAAQIGASGLENSARRMQKRASVV
jgi:DNA-binding SARP family transcriptional activator